VVLPDDLIEGVHPLEGGAFRLKFRGARRYPTAGPIPKSRLRRRSRTSSNAFRSITKPAAEGPRLPAKAQRIERSNVDRYLLSIKRYSRRVRAWFLFTKSFCLGVALNICIQELGSNALVSLPCRVGLVGSAECKVLAVVRLRAAEWKLLARRTDEINNRALEAPQSATPWAMMSTSAELLGPTVQLWYHAKEVTLGEVWCMEDIVARLRAAIESEKTDELVEAAKDAIKEIDRMRAALGFIPDAMSKTGRVK
jgi:hypothetical protein